VLAKSSRVFGKKARSAAVVTERHDASTRTQRGEQELEIVDEREARAVFVLGRHGA
jgi:hypothetical protein